MHSIDDFWDWNEYDRQIEEGWNDNLPEPSDDDIYKNDNQFFSEVQEDVFFYKI